MIQFDLPKDKSSIIKVIGVGGGGSNAVNFMFNQHIEGVNFIVCNTDAQSLAVSQIPNRIQLGPHLTQGLGAGANPEIGRQATEESLAEIHKILEVNTKMAFITAGMGGGTGTGGAPIIAKICKDLGILTVGIVTTPFSYEGKKRQQHASQGIENLREYVDTLLIINNDKLRHQYGDLKVREAFSKADNVLATAAKCITDVINTTGQINVDFADVCTVMRNGGVAILGNAKASGESRAQKAIEDALNSPLLNDNNIYGAKWILININSALGEHEFTMDEVDTIQNYLIAQAGEGTDVILGLGYDNSLQDEISITIIATGFDKKNVETTVIQKTEPKSEEKIILMLEPNSTQIGIEPKQTLIHEEELEMNMIEKELIEDVKVKNYLMPIMVEETKTEINKIDEEAPILWNLNKISNNNSSTAAYVSMPMPENLEEGMNKVENEKTENLISKATSGGYLTPPINIYNETNNDLNKHILPDQSMFTVPIAEHDELLNMQMELIEKEEKDLPVIEPVVLLNKEIKTDEQKLNYFEVKSNLNYTDRSLENEDDAQQKRLAERLQKLRNLSYNIQPEKNNEFENVPAFMRRNQALETNESPVEKFYSSYEIKTTENNQAEISTINIFLDGKKPD